MKKIILILAIIVSSLSFCKGQCNCSTQGYGEQMQDTTYIQWDSTGEYIEAAYYRGQLVYYSSHYGDNMRMSKILDEWGYQYALLNEIFKLRERLNNHPLGN